MVSPLRALIALVPFVVFAACGDSDQDNAPTAGSATVQFINATSGGIDVSNGGVVSADDGNVGFGSFSACNTVNTTGTLGSGLAFNEAGTTTSIPGFTQNFSTSGNYTVIAYPDATGTTQFLTVDNTGMTPTSGQAGLRIVNAASGSGNLVALGGGTALGTGTGVGYGTAGSYMSVGSGSQAVTFNAGTDTTTIANAGNLNFTAGQNYMLVVAPPAVGTTTYRTFLVQGC